MTSLDKYHKIAIMHNDNTSTKAAHPNHSTPSAKVDVAIVGGGVAGLFILNRLRAKGYSAVLIENKALGSGQTIHSQGIIHGGIKYALTGILSSLANATEDMPTRWKNCLQGKGDIDLTAVKLLSKDQLLWSTGSLSSDILGFFASKTLSSRVRKLKKEQFPTVLQNPQFKGQAWQLDEIVLDIPSLLHALSASHQSTIFKVNELNGVTIVLDESNELEAQVNNININTPTSNAKTISKPINGLWLEQNGKKIKLTAEHYIFTAGEGNELLSSELRDFPLMQRRPLQMIYMKWPENSEYAFYAHCIDHGINPRITITTHIANNNQLVWYLGGQIAEDGVNKSKEELIAFTQQELKALFPWLDFSQVIFDTFMINRAEAKDPKGKRPDSFSLITSENYSHGWPTKLALAPLLADKVLEQLQDKKIKPTLGNLGAFKEWNSPDIAVCPWNRQNR